MTHSNKFRTVDILGVNYAVTDYHGAAKLIVEQAANKSSFSVFALPVHGVIERRVDKEFDQAVATADMIVPDGQPIRWMMNLLHGTKLSDRVYGPKLLSTVLAASSPVKFRVFVYGGSTLAVQKKFIDYLQASYPNVEVCGAYREASAEVQTLTAQMVAQTNPNLVVVGLGCPKQEKWIARNKQQVNAVMMGVGAAFSFFAGEVKIAPTWMQNRGLEWLYRLLKEPRRLWKRYFFTNTYFLLLVIREFVYLGKKKITE